MTEFFETVSSNRDGYIEFFTDKAAALRWLGVAADGLDRVPVHLSPSAPVC